MRVLVVAPDMQLNNAEDFTAAASGNRLTVLNHMVTVREVLAHISSGKFDIIHFATHGCQTALQVSDSEIPADQLEDALRAAGNVKLVILGACKSIAIAAQIYRAGVPRVLSWRDDVTDTAALTWAQTFYASLRMSGDIWDATVTAGEAVRRLNYEPPIYLNGRMSLLEAEVQRLSRRDSVAGLPTWAFALLVVYGALMAGILASLLW